MIEVKTENARAHIFKDTRLPGLELHHWWVYNDQAIGRFRLKSPHFHEEFQIGFICQGKIENNYHKKPQIIHPHQVYFIQPGEVHAECLLENTILEFWFVFISLERMHQAVLGVSQRHTTHLVLPQLLIAEASLNEHLFYYTQTFFKSFYTANSSLEQEASFLHWVSLIVEHCQERKFVTPPVGPEKKAINFAIDYLHENFAEKISLDQLAQACCLSKFHLLRSFNCQIGMTIHQYQTNLRICKAKTLLLEDKPPVEVAYELGFSDQAHFTRSFKRFTSQTPKQFYKSESL